MNGKISTSNNSSVSTLTSPYVTSRNYEVCLLQNKKHKKIKYSDFSETQSIPVHCEIDAMETQIKLLDYKTWNSVIFEYFKKDKATEEVVSEMDIITTSSSTIQVAERY